MSNTPSVFSIQIHEGASRRADGWLALIVGCLFTLALFLGLSHVDLIQENEHPQTADDTELVAVMLPPPPPPKDEEVPDTPAPEMLAPLGIEIAASDSPVEISAIPLPPDLHVEVPVAPPARIKFDVTTFAPSVQAKMEQVDVNRIYNRNEVDQPPQVRNRVIPRIPSYLMDGKDSFRLVALLVVDRMGQVAETKLLKTSGTKAVDNETIDALSRWDFIPAMKKGKRVKCRTQFPVVITKGRGNPFEL